MNEENMNEENQEKDYFWLYVGGIAFVLIAVVLWIKQIESEKFAPISQQLDEETNSMNIRILSDSSQPQ